ncbi:MAG: dehydratase, partial [Variovorax paradoxus]
RGMVVMRCETRNQRGEVLQRFSPKMVVSRRPKA